MFIEIFIISFGQGHHAKAGEHEDVGDSQAEQCEVSIAFHEDVHEEGCGECDAESFGEDVLDRGPDHEVSDRVKLFDRLLFVAGFVVLSHDLFRLIFTLRKSDTL